MKDDIDPTIKALVSAIGEAETGQSSPQAYSKRGASGEYGRYQFMPDTWKAYASEAGVNVPLEQADIATQNKVAYNKIKQWKDAGYNPAQIASMWNAGPGRPNAYKEGWKGVNDKGVAYDTPAYVQKVSDYYTRKKAEMQLLAPTAGAAAVPGEKKEDKSFTQELKDIATNRMGQAGEAINKGLEGQQGVGSTLLQTGGAAAGGILDVLGAGIKAVPVVGQGVEMAEKALGKGAEKVLSTEPGQAALKGYQSWAEKNPTAAANVGAIANIASAVPIVRGVSAGVRGLISAPGMIKEGLTPSAYKEADAVNELAKTIERRATGAQLLRTSEKRGLDPLGIIVKERVLPDIEVDAKGTKRYNTAQADARIEDTVDMLDDQLDMMLASASNNMRAPILLDDLKDIVLVEIEKEFKGSPDLKKAIAKVEDDFDNFALSYNKGYVTLNEMNKIKREIRKSVKFDTPSLDESARYHEGQVFMRVIENVARSQGLGDVRRINKEMASRLEAQRLLRKYINGKSVAENPGWQSLMGQTTELGLVSGTEAVGQAMGAPMVGAFGGKLVSNKMRAGKPGAIERLNRSAQKAKPKRISGLRTALISQGAYRGYQDTQQQ